MCCVVCGIWFKRFTMRLKRNLLSIVIIVVSIVGTVFAFINYQMETGETAHINSNTRQTENPSYSSVAEDFEEFLVDRSNNKDDVSNVSHTQIEYDFDQVQRHRKTHLNGACDRLNQTRTLPRVSPASTFHFIISDKFKFLFCFVPKIACTTWKGIMIQLYHNQVGPTKKRFVKLDEIGSPEKVKKRWQNYKKVVFVREPLARVLSAYLNKLRDGDKKIQTKWERRFGAQIANIARKDDTYKRRNSDFTFVEFIKFILKLGPDIKLDSMKDHWLPYSSFTHPCRIQYDYIGHFETLAYDGPTIIKKLGVEDVVQFPEVHGSAAVDGLQTEYAKVPIDLILKLQEYYKMDYELFGYSKEESLKLVLGNRTTSDMPPQVVMHV
ncbi:carbohydrate sulfotransferase 13-like [Amphiura filiformis]|uniref:carbohydrate sulfotransferase 13-like n=1 Tax=Amphiura filiformis TaxID=82378 RepID=UPI003B21B6FA